MRCIRYTAYTETHHIDEKRAITTTERGKHHVIVRPLRRHIWRALVHPVHRFAPVDSKANGAAVYPLCLDDERARFRGTKESRA